MDYRPITGVWEITMGCNMRCKHCGSACENPLKDELTTDEALKLCDDLGELGFHWITLSGGEPTIRKDWPLIAKRLNQNNIIPNMITNGWLLNETIIDQAVEAGINTIAISVDGLEATHDYIRKPGSFQRIMSALDLLKLKGGVAVSIITTVNNRNIAELEPLRDILALRGVRGWQLQIGLPMGNMSGHGDLLMEPRHVDEVINFAYDTMKDGRIEAQLADCMGYYNVKEIEVRKVTSKSDYYDWQGCPAGKYCMGIFHNGDITGCTSIRNKEYVAGNIRRTPVKEIWESPDNFLWNRQLTKDKLNGFCKICKYGQYCLGGCTNTRLTMGGHIHAENEFCSYHLAVGKARKELGKVEDATTLLSKARFFIEHNNYQLAEIVLSRFLNRTENSPNQEALNLYGLTSFMLGNYLEAKAANEKVLKMNPRDAYAHKGLGLSLSRLGQVDEGIEWLKKAITLADESFMEPYYDLAVILTENDRKAEAISILETGRQKSPQFVEMSQPLYDQLKCG